MSKELEAFERIKNITYDRTDLYGIEVFREDLDTIERALRREDSIEITAIDIEQDNKELYKENKELKQALEIIIKKEVEIGFLKGILHADKSLHTANFYNSYFVATYRHLDQEEFDLLKEILL